VRREEELATPGDMWTSYHGGEECTGEDEEDVQQEEG
jgi:hypothetical protein